MSTENDILLDVKHLKIYFPVTRGIMRKKVADVKAVDDVSFIVNVGETLGLVGESGCGKTTVGRGILRLIEPTAGQVFFEGQNILTLSAGKMRQLRRKMSLMFQDPLWLTGSPPKCRKHRRRIVNYSQDDEKQG